MLLSLSSLVLLGLASVPQLVSAACECGYNTHLIHSNQNEVYTDVLESDFLHLNDIIAQRDWVRQVWSVPPVSTAPWGRNMTLDDVTTNPLSDATRTEGVNGGDPGLQLWVRSGEPRGGSIPGAEIASARRDMRFGSFRAGMKYTGEPGTCGAFFWYFNDTQEIDVELLSSQNTDPNKAPLFLVIHAAVKGQLIHDFHTVGFRPDQGYHEYRFDWTPEKVTYYADGQFLWESTTGVPLHEGGLTLNHWSNGDPGWTRGPPANDAHMEFSYIKAYFNSTDEGRNNEYKMRCHDPRDSGAICTVPDQTSPPDPSQSTTFLSPNKGLSPAGDQPIAPKPASSAPANPVPSNPSPSQPASSQQPALGPSQPVGKKVTPDATCGGEQGYTCLGGTFGDCCSSYGYCGSTALYCKDPKCQPDFGKCGGGS